MKSCFTRSRIHAVLNREDMFYNTG